MLSEKIAHFVESAARLQALVNDKSTTSTAIKTAERELQELVARRLPASQLDDLKVKRARLNELNAHLVELGSAVDHDRIVKDPRRQNHRTLVDQDF
jgi:hypothetical protein